MRSLTKKIFYSIILSSVITLLIGFALVLGIYYHHFNSMQLSNFANEANHVATAITNNGLDFLNRLSSTRHITWLTTDGTVLYDSHGNTQVISLPDCAEITEAIETGTGSELRFDPSNSSGTLYYAVLLDDGTIVRLAAEQPTFSNMLSVVFGSLIILILVIIVLSAIIADRMSAHIIKPINELNITFPDESTSYRELAPLIKRIVTQNRFITRQMDALRSRHEEFTVITENMSEGFLLVDENRNIISFNSSARRILDLGVESNVIEHRSALGVAIDSALSGQRDERETSFGGADYRIIATPVLNDQTVTGAVVIILDITEKSRREAMRREFTSNVSHELRTPMTSINAAAEMLANGIVAPQDCDRFFCMIQKESARLITLINDILRLSQLDENAVIEEKQTVDLRALAESVISSLSTAADAKNISLELVGEAHISGVPTILEEMLFNLCDNAVKYNKPDGKVTVTFSSTDDTVTLSVADTGIGIPQHLHERIFERFYRVDKSRSKQIGGTGLGLSIVRHAANYHNAEIHVDSRIDYGTTISIVFNTAS